MGMVAVAMVGHPNVLLPHSTNRPCIGVAIKEMLFFDDGFVDLLWDLMQKNRRARE